MTIGERCDRLRGVVTARAIAAGHARWLTDLLVRLGGGPRLAAWTAAGGPVGPFEATFVGDPDVERLVNDVLSRLPPPVAWHVARAVLVIGHGATGGFCAVIPKLPDCDEARQVVALNLSAVPIADQEGIIAHEFAHAWTFDRVDPDDVVSSSERRGFYAGLRPLFTKYPELIEEAANKDLQLEYLACALAREWQFSGAGTETAVALRGTIKTWSKR